MKSVFGKTLNKAFEGVISGPRWPVLLLGIVFLAGAHSIFFGVFIYFFTDFFYELFFSVAIENIFFVRQVGIFLFLSGLFYLFPLLDLKKYNRLVLLTVASKTAAVLFLLTNAKFTSAPAMVQLAAFGDGLMAVSLMFSYVVCKKKGNFEDGE